MPDWLSAWIGLLVSSSVLIVLVLLARRLLADRLSSRWLSILWMAVLVRLTIPISLPLPLRLIDLFTPIRTEATMPTPVSRVPIGEDALQPRVESPEIQANLPAANRPDQGNPLELADERPNPNQAVAAARPIDWQTVLCVFWLLGFLIAVLVPASKTARFVTRLRGQQPLVDPSLLTTVGRVAEMLNLKRSINVRRCDFLPVPAVYGWVRSTLLIPEVYQNDVDPMEMESILIHELTHIRRNDTLRNMAWTLICAIYWFHPLVWIAAAASRDDAELACDHAVIERLTLFDRLAYSANLVRAARQVKSNRKWKSAVALAFIQKQAQIRRRIRRIIHPQRLPAWQRKLLAILMIPISLVCFSSACQPTPSQSAVVKKDQNIDQLIERTRISGSSSAGLPTFEWIATSSARSGSDDSQTSAAQVGTAPSGLSKMTTSAAAITAPGVDPIAMRTLSPWVEDFKGTTERIRIHVNACVDVPETPDLPVAEVVPESFSQDRIEQMGRVLLAGGPYQKGWQPDRRYYEKLILKAKEQLSAEEAKPEKERQQLRISHLQASLENYQKEYNQAPERIEAEPAGLTVGEVPEYNGFRGFIVQSGQPGAFYDYSVLMSGNMSKAQISRSAGPGTIGNAYQLRGDLDPDQLRSKGLALSRQAAEQTASAWVALLAPEMRLADTVASSSTASGQKYAWKMIFTRSVNGCPTLFEGHDHGQDMESELQTQPVLYERIFIDIDDDGLVSFEWNSPMKVIRILNPQVVVLSQEEIRDKARTMLLRIAADLQTSLNRRIPSERLRIDLNVNRMTLGLARVSIKNKPGHYRLIPVWDFYGDKDFTELDAQGNPIQLTDKKKVPAGSVNNRHAILTLSALDGAPISRDLGQ